MLDMMCGCRILEAISTLDSTWFWIQTIHQVVFGTFLGQKWRVKFVNFSDKFMIFIIFGNFWKKRYEMGIFDLPATINYVLNQTDNQKLYYIGHSQGGTTLIVLLSEKPEFNDKIYAASLLGPLGYIWIYFISSFFLHFLYCRWSNEYRNRLRTPKY